MTTKIEWCDETWNPITGCTPVSEGCEHCYARRMATRLAGRCGYPRGEYAFRPTFHKDRLGDPLHWRKPRRVFVCSMGDLFHEKVQGMHIDAVFAMMALTPRHTYMLLTKRPDRMESYCDGVSLERIAAHACIIGEGAGIFVHNYLNGWSMPREIGNDGNPCNGTVKRWPLPNVWLGVTAENQQRADERIPTLLRTPAAVRFVSVEPMLGPVDLSRWIYGKCFAHDSDVGGRGKCEGHSVNDDWLRQFHWVICGGETGSGARPCEKTWVRSLSNQCHAADVPFFAKKFGWKAEGPMARREWPEESI